MTRRPFIAGNWKMYQGGPAAASFARELRLRLEAVVEAQIAVAPPFTALSIVAEVLQGSPLQVAGQDCFWEPEGAFTGEVSARMLREAGASHVIIAHSERRQHFHESNGTANRKVKAALAEGLGVILCVGESLEEREAGRTLELVRSHVQEGLRGLQASQLGGLVIAYEPVWAIGTGRTATPEQAQEVHAFIRRLLAEGWGDELAKTTRIQYGGSVKPENARELLAQPDIDGALVGGASLKAESFQAIVQFTSN